MYALSRKMASGWQTSRPEAMLQFAGWSSIMSRQFAAVSEQLNTRPGRSLQQQKASLTKKQIDLL